LNASSAVAPPRGCERGRRGRARWGRKRLPGDQSPHWRHQGLGFPACASITYQWDAGWYHRGIDLPWRDTHHKHGKISS